MAERRRGMKRKSFLRPLYITLVLVFLYLPLVFVVMFSFNPSKNAGVMTGFTLDWYVKLFQNESLKQALWTSLQLAFWSCLLSAVLGTLGAVGMARVKFRGQGLLESVTSLPIMLPEVVLGMAFMSAFSMANLPFGMLTLVIAHTTFCIPYVFLIVKGRLAGMDPQLTEAARDLGASPTRAFFDVTLPLIMPAVLSGMLLALAMSLDDLIISTFVTGATTSTLPLKIYSSLRTGVSPEINALCTLMLGVVCIAVALSQLLAGRHANPTKQGQEALPHDS